MNAPPKVSLLIPSYNNVETVSAAIHSCMRQTFSDLEILIYDEASSDGTRDIIQAAAEKDDRIKVFTSDSNSGPVLAWRRLLTEAQGEYFTFVWSDDLLMPQYVERMKGVLEANPGQLLAGCSTFTELVPENMQDDPCVAHPNRKQIYKFNDMRLPGDLYALGLMAGFFPITQICSFYRTAAAREVFDHYIQFENPYGFDYSRRAYGNEVSFLSELALRGDGVSLIHEPLVTLRASRQSMTTRAMASHRFDFWLQYVWAITSAWQRCQALSPRMGTLIRIATDRLHLCDTVAAVANRRRPRYCNPWRIARALVFMMRFDRRFNQRADLEALIRWAGRQG